MVYEIASGSVIRVVMPGNPSIYARQAHEFLSRGIQQRVEVWFETSFGDWAGEDPPSCVIRFCTLDSLPDRYKDTLEPPITIQPYADYGEHLNIRTFQENNTVNLLILTGDEKTLIAGIGVLLREFLYYDNCIKFDPVQLNLRPLTPTRGAIFCNTPESGTYGSWSTEQWDSILTEYALLGHNLIGFAPSTPERGERLNPFFPPPPNATKEETRARNILADRQSALFDRTHELGLKGLLHLSLSSFTANGKSTLKNIANAVGKQPGCDLLWLTCTPSLFPPYASAKLSQNRFLASGKQLSETARQHKEIETWLGTDGFGEEELADLLDAIVAESPFAKALTCGPNHSHKEMLMREMPLMMQIATIVNLSDTGRLSWQSPRFGPERSYVVNNDTPLLQTEALAKQFFDNAPLTYGAIGLCRDLHDCFNRFFWALMAWDPQPQVDEILAKFGNYYFGAESAEWIQNTFREMEICWSLPLHESFDSAQRAFEHLEKSMACVPPRMRNLAIPIYNLLSYRIVLDMVLYHKLADDREQMHGLQAILGNQEEEIDISIKKALDYLRVIPNNDLLANLYKDLDRRKTDLYCTWRFNPKGNERIQTPLAGQTWYQTQLEKALQSKNRDTQQAICQNLRQRLNIPQQKTDILVDCGNPDADTYCRRGLAFSLNPTPLDQPVSRWTMTIGEDQDEPIEYSIPIMAGATYKAVLAFYAPSQFPLFQSLFCGDTSLLPNFTVHEGEWVMKELHLGPWLLHDDSFVLIIYPKNGHRAAISEITLFLEDTRISE
ncbi:hypothetical protein GF373_13935 [bacterium]|nr:hypothetical protein [bacterium]